MEELEILCSWGSSGTLGTTLGVAPFNFPGPGPAFSESLRWGGAFAGLIGGLIGGNDFVPSFSSNTSSSVGISSHGENLWRKYTQNTNVIAIATVAAANIYGPYHKVSAAANATIGINILWYARHIYSTLPAKMSAPTCPDPSFLQKVMA